MTTTLRSGVLMTDTEYGVVLLDERTGAYYTLNPTAALVVRTLDEGGDEAAAAAALVTRFGVDRRTASEDVAELVGSLRTAGLLRR
ncbi:lasso peptide biosynthesis PqqD family chaperone [Catenuloplanes atrovinosus]|uniref:PqqD family protein of HPr-rel-A system n=1 Tax=Catenuloplanes atrovinosus TaxID=137266 RepID=A0AAE3YN37_9ACTN|nr:lasso peptide biosynthesis PqqD family chaperone [Catenuloplanes atrovinosus]MDR7276848.1 PqqD family protein of HPr-rel-A system [Catenuloplanes atrovinosus]